jgi:hypothetical protein
MPACMPAVPSQNTAASKVCSASHASCQDCRAGADYGNECALPITGMPFMHLPHSSWIQRVVMLQVCSHSTQSQQDRRTIFLASLQVGC